VGSFNADCSSAQAVGTTGNWVSNLQHFASVQSMVASLTLVRLLFDYPLRIELISANLLVTFLPQMFTDLH
jgi:hypothetical protein